MKFISVFSVCLFLGSTAIASTTCCNPKSIPTPLVAMNISKDAIYKPVEQRLQWAQKAGFTAQHEVTLREIREVVPAYDKYQMHLAAVYELIDLEKEDDLTWIDKELKALEQHSPLIFLGLKGGSPSSTDLDDKAISLIQKYSDSAAEYGINIVLYPHAYYYIERFDDAKRLAEKVNRANVGVIFNLCHFLMVQPEDDWKATLESGGEKLWAVTCNGADIGGKDWSTLIQPLDQGSFDTSAFLKHLQTLSFNGLIALQDYGVKGNPTDTLKRSLLAYNEVTKSAEPNL